MSLPNQFRYDEWVVPISTNKSKHLNSSWYHLELDSHIGHAIKVKNYSYMGSSAGWKYRCSGLWYAESDLVAKEDFKSMKVISKSSDIASCLDELL